MTMNKLLSFVGLAAVSFAVAMFAYSVLPRRHSGTSFLELYEDNYVV